MGRKAKLDTALPKVISFFSDHSPRALRLSHIDEIVYENRTSWGLAKATSPNQLVKILLEESPLSLVKLKFRNRGFHVYTWGEVSVFELVQALGDKSYFSHHSAIFLHGLTEQIPKSVYLNTEQSPKPSYPTELSQPGIHRAFKRTPRTTNMVSTYDKYRIYLLNGKATGNFGVERQELDEGGSVNVTSLERTLIDAVVRPFYAGGGFEILKAYKAAHDSVSINRLNAMLHKLDYKYPYHQCIGFLLEAAGVYSEEQIGLMQQNEIKYDFYLTHNMKNPSYSKRWKLFFPKGLQ